jgi:aspartate oxidase
VREFAEAGVDRISIGALTHSAPAADISLEIEPAKKHERHKSHIPEHVDVLVLGSGLAGCATAWAAAEQGAEVAIVTRAHQPEESNSFWAQGGIVFRGRDDSPELLARDILEAGANLGDPGAVGVLAREGPEARASRF